MVRRSFARSVDGAARWWGWQAMCAALVVMIGCDGDGCGGDGNPPYVDAGPPPVDGPGPIVDARPDAPRPDAGRDAGVDAPLPPDGGVVDGPRPPTDGGVIDGPTPPDGGLPDGGSPPPDGGPIPDGGPPPPDGGPVPDGGPPPPDGGLPPDGGPIPDGGPPPPDGGLPDGGSPPPDGGPLPPDGGLPDGGPPPPDGGPPPHDGGPPDGGLPDGGNPDAPLPPPAPHIFSVVNEDGGEQVRQSSFSKVVITGENLANAFLVTVAAMPAAIDSNTATEIRATVFTGYGTTPGPINIAVVTAGGAHTDLGGLTMTPYVLSATQSGGRGTYESPMALCDISFPPPSSGDLLLLGGGVHTCGSSLFIESGVTIEGAADGSTIITGAGSAGFGFFFFPANPAFTTTLRRLSFEQPLDLYSVNFSNDSLLVEDVADEGGLFIGDADQVEIDGYVYNGEGSALHVTAAGITLTDVVVHCQNTGGADDGIFMGPRRHPFEYGVGTLERVRVEHCQRGLVLGPMPAPHDFPPSDLGQYQMWLLELLDNVIGMDVGVGHATLYDPIIRGDDFTPQVTTHAINIRHGDVSLVGGKLTGTKFGVEAVTTAQGGFFEPHTQLVLDGTEIVGGEAGVSFHGFDGGSDLRMRRCVVRDQTVVGVRVSGYESHFDLGTPGDPGQNQLSVHSGFALEDARTDALPLWPTTDAAGTTLNGHSYAGQLILGPAQQGTDYRILDSDGAIQF